MVKTLKNQELKNRIKKVLELNDEAIHKQHKKGKFTARERIDYLVDKGSFVELDMFMLPVGMSIHEKKKLWGDAVITGFASINGRKVYLFAQDFSVMGGSLGKSHASKICKVMDMAVQDGVPIIGLLDSGGARIQEGLGHYGAIFHRNVVASGVVPQISLILGPCAGGASYSPALSDFIFMVDKISKMFITGPGVVKAVSGVEPTMEELGGAEVHNEKSGVAHFKVADEKTCFEAVKTLLSYLPSNCHESPPTIQTLDDPQRLTPELEDIIPQEQKLIYDIRDVVRKVVDNEEFFEVQEMFARNIVIGFARLNGNTVGIIANQPNFLGGCLDINASDKAARFILFCDSFNIPIINFVDCPGYLPGLDQEHNGIIRHGAKMLYAYSEATVPRITVVVRKAYGGAMSGMAVNKYGGTDFSIALPTAEIAILGPEAAANVIFKSEIEKSESPETVRQEKIREYREYYATPYVAAEQGWLDAVIAPEELRAFLIKSYQMLSSKKVIRPAKKHGIIPM